MKFSAFIIGMVMSASAIAIDLHDIDKAGFDKLSEAEKAAVITQINKTAGSSSTISLDDVEQVINIGESIGKGLGSAAKELGIAVNDFAKTDVGFYAMILISWHFIGSMLVHFIGGLLVWILGTSMILYLIRLSKKVYIKYDSDTGKIISKDIAPLSDDATENFAIAQGVVIVVGLLAMFSF